MIVYIVTGIAVVLMLVWCIREDYEPLLTIPLAGLAGCLVFMVSIGVVYGIGFLFEPNDIVVKTLPACPSNNQTEAEGSACLFGVRISEDKVVSYWVKDDRGALRNKYAPLDDSLFFENVEEAKLVIRQNTCGDFVDKWLNCSRKTVEYEFYVPAGSTLLGVSAGADR